MRQAGVMLGPTQLRLTSVRHKAAADCVMTPVRTITSAGLLRALPEWLTGGGCRAFVARREAGGAGAHAVDLPRKEKARQLESRGLCWAAAEFNRLGDSVRRVVGGSASAHAPLFLKGSTLPTDIAGEPAGFRDASTTPSERGPCLDVTPSEGTEWALQSRGSTF